MGAADEIAFEERDVFGFRAFEMATVNEWGLEFGEIQDGSLAFQGSRRDVQRQRRGCIETSAGGSETHIRMLIQ